jgi:gamma-glutamyltranspeptidase/glutathione hydrolase
MSNTAKSGGKARDLAGEVCRQLAIAAALSLSCCSVLDGSTPPASGGRVVGDEPQAVQAGADVLARGGDAADAAAATYLALSVTYPVAAGLGGGGLCIVYDSTAAKAEEFDFLAREPAGGGAYAIPGNVAGFALLQTVYGRLPWQRIVSSAETFAATGFSMSQALHARLSTNQDVIRLDADLASEFFDETGQLKPAGVVLRAPALAQTLSQIRINGANALVSGAIADEIAGYAQAQGGAITSAELSSYRVERSAPAQQNIGDEIVFLPSVGVGAGQYARALLARLVDRQGQIIDADHAAVAVATGTRATLDAFKIASLPRDMGATGFAATDAAGQAVACAVTMNGALGSGHTAGNSGVLLAAAPKNGDTGISGAFLTPAIATSGGSLSLTGAGAGGPNGTAMIALALLDFARGQDLTQPGALHATGLEPFETVNVIQCRSDVCATVPDPKAFGLGAAGQ